MRPRQLGGDVGGGNLAGYFYYFYPLLFSSLLCPQPLLSLFRRSVALLFSSPSGPSGGRQKLENGKSEFPLRTRLSEVSAAKDP